MPVKKWPAALLLFCFSFPLLPDALAQSSAAPQDTLPVYKRVNIDTSQAGWRKLLEANVDPSVPIKNGAPDGEYTIYVQFLIDENGNPSDVRALTAHGYGMEKEVVRALQKSPRWTPATENRQQVKAYRKQSVTFSVITEGGNKKRRHATRRSYITVGS